MIYYWEVWKRPLKHVAYDTYYAVLSKNNYYSPNSSDNHELIKEGFRSYEAALDFINVLTKLKGEAR